MVSSRELLPYRALRKAVIDVEVVVIVVVVVLRRIFLLLSGLSLLLSLCHFRLLTRANLF